MLIAKCDKCENTEEVSHGHVIPAKWAEITINGRIPTKQGGLNRQSFRMLLCPEDSAKIFDTSLMPEKNIQEQFHDAAADYMSELACEQLENAAETQ